MDWEKIYREKMQTTEEAASLVEPGDVIFVGCNGCLAKTLIDSICAREDLSGVRMLGSSNGDDFSAVSDASCFDRVSYCSVFLGSSERRNYPGGNVQVNSIHYHNLSRTMREVYGMNALVIECSEPDEEGYLYYGIRGTCWGKLDEIASKIILQVNPQQQRAQGRHNKIHVSRVTALCWHDHPVRPYENRPSSKREESIARNILPYIHDGDVIQVGVGSIPNAIARQMFAKRDLGIYSEVLTAAMIDLIHQGAVDKTNIQVAFALPPNGILDEELLPYVQFAPIDELNHPFSISKIKNFVSINSCFMVDLTGQVCSENYGAGQYSGMGGQVDFIRGAAESEGGRSFLAFTSTHIGKDGKQSSNVRLNLPQGAVVTAQRCDVMYLATEWGIANIFNQPLEERAYALINIAHPDFRMELFEEACRSGLIRPCAADISRISVNI